LSPVFLIIYSRIHVYDIGGIPPFKVSGYGADFACFFARGVISRARQGTGMGKPTNCLQAKKGAKKAPAAKNGRCGGLKNLYHLFLLEHRCYLYRRYRIKKTDIDKKRYQKL
jgi:hypothetical protein